MVSYGIGGILVESRDDVREVPLLLFDILGVDGHGGMQKKCAGARKGKSRSQCYSIGVTPALLKRFSL